MKIAIGRIAFVCSASSTAGSCLNKLLQFTEVQIALDPEKITKANLVKPRSDAWRVVWDECDGFNEGRSIFILLAGKRLRGLSQEYKAAILRAPWTIVLDFDEAGDQESLLLSAKDIIEKKRSFQHILPGQSAPSSYTGITYWFSANGYNPIAGNGYSNLSEWRKGVIDTISEIGKRLGRATAPKPVTIVVLRSRCGNRQIK